MMTTCRTLAVQRKGHAIVRRTAAGRQRRDGDTLSGSRATEVFVRDEPDGSKTLAALSYDAAAPHAITVDLARLGLSGSTTYTVRDVWSGATTTAAGMLAITLAPGDSKLVVIAP